MKPFIQIPLILLSACITSGCMKVAPAHGDRSRLFEVESKLGTTPPLFHAAHSQFEGYLVSLEKVDRSDSKFDGKAPNYDKVTYQGTKLFDFDALSKNFTADFHDPEKGVEKITSMLDANWKVHVVSQITHFSKDETDKKGLTTKRRQLFNIYGPDAPTFSEDAPNRSEIHQRTTRLLDTGAEALIERLGADVAHRLRTNSYSHIFVLSTGWNTPAWESELNYSDWQQNLARAMGDQPDFKPLFIGFSWASMWEKPKSKPFSFFNKADDADEIGLTWANLVLNRIVPQAIAGLTTKPKVVVVGLSFGARMMCRAVNSKEALVAGHAGRNVDLFLGLQSAFSINRFLPVGREHSPFAVTFTNTATRYVFTTSSNDTAVNFAPGSIFTLDHKSGIYLGDPDVSHYIQKVSKKHPEVADFIDTTGTVSESGVLKMAPSQKPIWIIDASPIIKNNVYGSGGGAHSDVYNVNVARLISQVLPR